MGNKNQNQNQSQTFKYKKENSLEERKKIFLELSKNNPDKIPVVIENSKGNALRRLLPMNFTISQVLFLLRKKFDLTPEVSYFLLADGKKYVGGEITIGEVYAKYKDLEDGFLYFLLEETKMYG